MARSATRAVAQRSAVARQALGQRRISKSEVDDEFGIRVEKMGRPAAAAAAERAAGPAATVGRAPPSPEKTAAVDAVASDRRRGIVANGVVEEAGEPRRGFYQRQLSDDAQNALRGHHNAVLKTYGLSVQDESLGHNWKVEIRTPTGMGRAKGMYAHDDGTVALTPRGLDNVVAHAKLAGHELTGLGRDMVSNLDDPTSERGRQARSMIETYHVSTHEAIHNHGPTLEEHWSRNMLEEVSTEMVARRVTSDIHDVPIEHVPGSYQRYIDPAVDEIRSVASRAGVGGVTVAEAHRALAHASMQFKQQTGKNLDPSIEIFRLGRAALEKLGVHSIEANRLLHNNLLSIAQDT